MLSIKRTRFVLVVFLIYGFLFSNFVKADGKINNKGQQANSDSIEKVLAAQPEDLSRAQEQTENKFEPQDQEKEGAEFGMGASIGSVTINGEIYNQISLRPELTLGKLGIGLDIYFYMDEEGNIRGEDWDEFSDYLKKIYYVRWGRPDDPFFFRVGALDQVTLGYGILMDGYTNTAQYPQERKIGVFAGMNGKVGWQALLADITELDGPGLLGTRISYQPLNFLKLEIGGSIVMDVDPYTGLNDDDNDGVANALDIYKKSNDNQVIDSLKRVLTPSERKYFRKAGINIPDSSILASGVPEIEDFGKNPTGAVAIDAGLPIFQNKIFKIDLYSQYAQFLPNETYYYRDSTKFTPGWGFSFPGVRTNILGFITTKVEYRYAHKNFLFNFWDRNYDFERTQIWDNKIYTKSQMKLYQDRVLKGVYGLLRTDIFNLITLESRYQHMRSASGNYRIRSFQSMASLNPQRIPKLAEATAFYQRNNDKNPFDFANPSSNTMLGYRIGLELGQGAVVYYVFQKSYQDVNGNGTIEPKNEAITINTIETGINF